ncbi:Uncharacterized protein APZ42_001029, partial [Daphnia magna]
VGQDAKLPTSITTPPAPAHSTRVLQENVRVSSFSLSDLSSSSTSSGVTCLHNGNVYRQISN